MNLADLILIEKRIERLKKRERQGGRAGAAGEAEGAARQRVALAAACRGWARPTWWPFPGSEFLTLKPLLLVLNVAEAEVAKPAPGDLEPTRANPAWAWCC